MRSRTPLELICQEWRQTHQLRRQGTDLRDRSIGSCRDCWDEVRWVRTEKGKLMPMDVEPDPRGRFVWRNGYKDASGYRVMHWLRDEELETNLRTTYSSHFDSCPARQKPVLTEEERFL